MIKNNTKKTTAMTSTGMSTPVAILRRREPPFSDRNHSDECECRSGQLCKIAINLLQLGVQELGVAFVACA
mgnify:CR=1 FL=1